MDENDINPDYQDKPSYKDVDIKKVQSANLFNKIILKILAIERHIN